MHHIFKYQIFFWFHFMCLLDISQHDLIHSRGVCSTKNRLAFSAMKIKHELVYLETVWLRTQEQPENRETVTKQLNGIWLFLAQCLTETENFFRGYSETLPSNNLLECYVPSRMFCSPTIIDIITNIFFSMKDKCVQSVNIMVSVICFFKLRNR